MINITIDKNGKPSPSTINIGNQWENRDEELVFSFPEEFRDFNKYVVAYIKNKKTKEEIRQVLPILNDTFVVSSGVTRYAGSWHLYTLCKENPLDLDGDTIDIRATNGERVSISDAITAIVSSNDIGDDAFQNFPMDENIKLIYDELFALKLEFEKADAVREENELARKHEESLRATAEEKRVSAEKTRESNETTRENQESSRVNIEEKRVSAEKTRESNETQRKANEQSRIGAEKQRESNTSTAIKNVEAVIKSVNDKTNSFNSSYSQKVKEFNDSYSAKTEAFNSNYNTKINSLTTKLDKFEADTDKVVNDSTAQFIEDIQAQGKKTLETIPEDYATLNKKVQTTYNNGQSYQNQINELQKSEALQDEALEKLKQDLDLKVTQPYLNNNDSTHITSSDNGSLKNIVVKGNAVQNSTKGINLFDFSKVISDGVNIIDYQKQTITIQAKTNHTGYNQTLAELCPNIIAGTYILSVTCSNSNAVKCIHLLESDKDINFSIACELTDEDINSKVAWYNNESSTVENVISNIQIEEGTTAHSYEPYTGGQPSPNPDYPQEVKGVSEINGKIVGKNLFDYTDSNNFGSDVKKFENGIITTKMMAEGTLNIPVEVGKTYALSFKVEAIYENSGGLRWSLQKGKNKPYSHDGSMINMSTGFKSNVEYSEKTRFTAESDYVSLCTIMNYVYDVQLEEGTAATDYKPYTLQKFNYALSKPLYYLSNSTYDYIDIDKGKIVRNVGVVTFDGSSDEVWNGYTNNPNMNGYMAKISDATENTNCICNKLLTTGGVSVEVNESVKLTNKNYLFIIINKSRGLDTVDLFKNWLSQNSITVYYQLSSPIEENIPTDLLKQLQQLKSYFPQTNIMFDTEVEPYINFDYKLNLKSWIEDKDNKEIVYDKQNKEKDKYSSTFFENMFALQRTGKIYTVKFPKWETSHISTGEKLDANAGLICEPSTKTIKGQNDYANIPLFKTYDVNAYVDDEGVRHVTAIKGDKYFKDEGKVDVFVLGMSYYEKYWEDDQYWYYSRTDVPKDGYKIARECINKDGSIQPYGLYSKYVTGFIEGKPYSSKGLKPARYYVNPTKDDMNTDNSYNGMINYMQKKGKYYCGGMACEYKYILTSFYLKYAVINSELIMAGCSAYSFQYIASIQSSDNNTYFPVTKSQANSIIVGAYVSVGYPYGKKTNTDRVYSSMHRYADDVKVLKKEPLDDNNVAIYLDIETPFNTMPVALSDGTNGDVYITSMHWRSGFSDNVLDRDGCPCNEKSELKNMIYPIVIQGIECMVGGYEVYGNAIMDIVDASGKREVYVTNDATKLTTNVSKIKETYSKSKYSINGTKLNSWNYITKIDFDFDNGLFVQSSTGKEGSSTSTGFADGVYFDAASSGQREFLGFGLLWSWSSAGLSCLLAHYGLGFAGWHCLGRISINGVGGELTTQ